jgi:glutamate/tyrosine decarboxylase-like PLP-dependent enzyme
VVDGHKWLNLPYDSGFVFCSDPDAHAASMSYTAAYLVGQGAGSVRAPSDYVPESSRRARGFVTWAALRELGRDGLADLVERCCALARRSRSSWGRSTASRSRTTSCSTRSWSGFGDDERTTM